MTRQPFDLLTTRRLNCATAALLLFSTCAALTSSLSVPVAAKSPVSPAQLWRSSLGSSASSSVRELIPAEYRKRYQKWKGEYLRTEAGRSQWERYAHDPHFILTVAISSEQGEGAIVDGFVWDEAGRLVAATITLGNKLDSGYPSSLNYPITCSLAPGNIPPEVKGNILAATKLAHEFGHLNFISNMDGRLYQLQNRLMLRYNSIFYANNRNTHDPRLLELAQQMGGTPVSIAQDRESWAEVGAILYLKERLPELNHHARIPRPIREAIQAYYLTYPDRAQTPN